MSDKALRGNKLTRARFARGGGSAPFLRGRSGADNIKAPRGKAGWKQMQQAEAKIGRAIRQKDTGLHKGSVRKAGSAKAMGTPRPHKTKSDYSLEKAIKQTKKMPDKKFRQDKTYELSTGKFGKIIKGSKGKKNYIKAMKRYHHAWQPKGKK